MNLVNIIKRLRPLPFRSNHAERTVIASADDDPGKPSDYLIDIALRTAQKARSISMENVCARMKAAPYFPEVWPGEHYKLLGGLMEELRPTTVIEIGTFTGLSALAMVSHLPQTSKLYTFDILPWDGFSDSVLRPEDFADNRLKQVLADVADPNVMKQHADLFKSADIMFIDGPKDVVFERKLLELFDTMEFPRKPLLVFDDIRVWNMLAIWRNIRKPKLDITSFGHWSGTGLVHWT